MPTALGCQPFSLKERLKRIMAKTICKLLGVVFVLVGIAGFVPSAQNLLGAHLSMAHNIVHIVSGLLALYFGFAGSLGGARGFALVFGAVYLLLGIAGFVMGSQGSSEMANMMTPDSHLWKVLPGTLELGTADHGIHIALGVIFLLGALATRTGGARTGD